MRNEQHGLAMRVGENVGAMLTCGMSAAVGGDTDRWSRPLWLEEIPAAIVFSEEYWGWKQQIISARATSDGIFVGVWFNDGSAHLWRMTGRGWVCVKEGEDMRPVYRDEAVCLNAVRREDGKGYWS